MTDINDVRQVVGSEFVVGEGTRAFLLGSIAGPQDLGILAGYTSSYATGINASGRVIGYSERAVGGGPQPRAFFVEKGRMTDLGILPGGTSSKATGINSAGQVVGWADGAGGGLTAFLYSNGNMSNLGGLPGSSGGEANAINDSGQIVGFSWVGGIGSLSKRAFLYSGGKFTDLGTG
ncbi:DUF3466 family protein [Aquisphaera giovannonii]|uniref:DUF3466 family protein n=1 Tax=Aquisphaera giovannonii TaxID=406548 RepID=UPI001AEFB4A2|nr:DUF3466 family protein [Aquisphaera giovannonii]